MLNELRKPFFILAMVLIVLAVAVEGAARLVGLTAPKLPAPAAGYGVPAMLLLDSLLILSAGLMVTPFLWSDAIQGKTQGVVTLVVSVVVLLAGLGMLFLTIQLLTLMVSLFLAAPFGTIAYLAAWGDFDRGGAATVLGLALMLKVGFVVCLLFAQQGFLAMKGLMLLIATSLGAVLLLTFLHGFVPGILVSITDMVGALVITILTLVWAVSFLIGGLVSVKRVVF